MRYAILTIKCQPHEIWYCCNETNETNVNNMWFVVYHYDKQRKKLTKINKSHNNRYYNTFRPYEDVRYVSKGEWEADMFLEVL